MRGVVRRATLRSLAKINLDLRILNKRPDNFHELRTVFQTISLADTIEISCEPAKHRKVTIDDGLQIPDNLIVRAAHAMLDDMRRDGARSGFDSKQIPMGGGLGGGSSNAAAVLLALPVLAGQDRSDGAIDFNRHTSWVAMCRFSCTAAPSWGSEGAANFIPSPTCINQADSAGVSPDSSRHGAGL